MTSKMILIALLLTTANLVWAHGGLSIDNVRKHMGAEKWVRTQASRQPIVVQGPIDKFDVQNVRRGMSTADTQNANYSNKERI